MILITGATGNVLRCVLSQLLGTGASVRELVHKPGFTALPGDVGIVRGDLPGTDMLDPCLERVEAAFLVWPIFAATPVGLYAVTEYTRRIVYLSSGGVGDDLEQQTGKIAVGSADKLAA